MRNTAPPNGGILAATARGAGWVVAWRMMTRLLGLMSTLILVRLLPPGAAVLAFLGLAERRPAGAEADMAALLRRITGRFAGLRGRVPLVRES